MLKTTKPSQNRLDIELSGTLTTDTMTEALDTLLRDSEGITSGRMLYTIFDFEMPTMGALAVEFRYMPKLFGLIGKFDKCAVLSDIAWVRTAAEIEGALFPGIDIKAFPIQARTAAEEWLDANIGANDREKENFPV